MVSLIIVCSVGIIISVLGIINMTGNISSLHSYHRHRVTEENIKPFGRAIGIGTLICGLSCIAYGILIFIYEKTAIEPIFWVSMSVLGAGLVIGLAITVYALMKYNKGIF